MKVTIEINCDGAAFEPDPGPEIARILAVLATWIREGKHPDRLHDINGNNVGTVTICHSEGRECPRCSGRGTDAGMCRGERRTCEACNGAGVIKEGS